MIETANIAAVSPTGTSDFVRAADDLKIAQRFSAG